MLLEKNATKLRILLRIFCWKQFQQFLSVVISHRAITENICNMHRGSLQNNARRHQFLRFCEGYIHIDAIGFDCGAPCLEYPRHAVTVPREIMEKRKKDRDIRGEFIAR